MLTAVYAVPPYGSAAAAIHPAAAAQFFERRDIMTEQELLRLAKDEGFLCAMIAPEDIPIDFKFRRYCEQNLCGQYGANYACPPDCGTPEELRDRILAQKHVLVVESIWDVDGFSNIPAMEQAKHTHNSAMRQLMQKVKDAGFSGFCAGYSGCRICDVCGCKEQKPCPYPEQRIDCLSSYCVDVAELAKRCSLDFAWAPNKLYLFGIIAFREA